MRRIGSSLLVGLAVLAFALLVAGSALGAPVWRITSSANTTVAPGGTLTYYVGIQNIGDENASGQIEVDATLPEGMTSAGTSDYNTEFGEMFTCTGEGTRKVRCLTAPTVSFRDSVPTASQDTVKFRVTAAPEASGVLVPTFRVDGAGASTAVTVDPTTVAATPFGFGLQAFYMQGDADSIGSLYTQAGGHPYDLVTHIDLNTEHNENIQKDDLWPAAPIKDAVVDLPPGLVGNPTILPECTASQLSAGYFFVPFPQCPSASQVGVVQITRSSGAISPILASKIAGPYALYNMVPPPGVPARFGFAVNGTAVVIDAKLRSSGSGYGLSVVSRDISEATPFSGAVVTFWGVPADPVHDPERGCPGQREVSEDGPNCPAGVTPQAFLRYPTSCEAGGLDSTLHVDSWENPGTFTSEDLPDPADPAWVNSEPVQPHVAPSYPYPPSAWGEAQGVTGCRKVPFTPTIEVQPTSQTPDSASGLQVTLNVPQEAITEPGQIGQADLKKAVVTLPEGMQINPSSADGLAACSSAQIELSSDAEPSCPAESQLGTVKIETPLLRHSLEGVVYLAAQNDNPFHALLALYVVAKAEGVIVKVPGHIEADPVTGRLTTTFDNLPQLPFSTMVLTLTQSSRAPLLTPAKCGSTTASATLEGWNEKVVSLSNSYEVECKPGGDGFNPSFAAGTISNQGGAFSPLELSLSRDDGEQRLNGLQVTLPPGLTAKLAGVPLCSDADAEAGTCPEASQIGTVSAGAGAGNPFFLPGKIYLTGPYNGGPFGEVVVVPAVAGPFNLGIVHVRGSIRINPVTAQATVVSDAFPQMVNGSGIPSDIRSVNVNIDRPGFVFNSTNCDELKTTAVISSDDGTNAVVSSRFEAANCGTLAFRPKFKVATSGRTSRANGASLHVKLTFPHPGPQAGSQSGEANIHSVHVQLPKALPARLTTLQKACTAAQFEANPAGCPPASIVGDAVAHTPILTSPLQGPAYFVSHGGAKFPELVLVLQGEGVTIDLAGETDIKNGVTSNTFAQVPDAPVTSFELTLPQGQYSALAANGDLCSQKLQMPTKFVAQNGAVLSQSTDIEVEGCSNTLTVKSKRVRDRAVTLGVWVPAAGELSASGKGLSGASKMSHKRQEVKLTLDVRRHEEFTGKIRLSFTPSSGKDRKKLVKSLRVRA
jgi:uncharacterized repeat protein (TIGR01451 family)